MANEKQDLEAELFFLCICEGEISINKTKHDIDCPAYKFLEELGF